MTPPLKKESNTLEHSRLPGHDAAPPAQLSQGKKDELPLPGWLTKLYYIFPIVLYVPDSIFNFWVYSDGSGIDFNHIGITQIPLIALWAFLAVGIVGMAWLLSVLAPWHWSRRNRFQAVMCWIGVIIATSITIWNSLAYRSIKFKAFATDQWLAQAFHITISGFSPTMILVSVAPPFWGLFWAIVQPAVQRRSLAEEQESHAMRMERLKQEAEVKRLKAEANAQVRQAQLKGLVATVRTARKEITGSTGAPVPSIQVVDADGDGEETSPVRLLGPADHGPLDPAALLRITQASRPAAPTRAAGRARKSGTAR
jgi:hypothetical protein